MVNKSEVYKKCSDKLPLSEIKSQHYGWGVRHLQIACMCACVTALYIARGCMGIAVLAMTDHRRRNDTDIEIYSWDKQTQGLILSSFFWGYVLMQIPGGLFAKRFGGKPIVMVGLVSSGIICLLLPWLAKTGGWALVCAARVTMGLTQACLFPSSHTLLGRWLPVNEITTYSGIVYGGAQIGTVISLPLSGILAETQLGWKLIFYSMSGMLLVVAGIWWMFTASTPGDHRWMSESERAYIENGLQDSGSYRSVKTPWLKIIQSKELWAIAVAHIGCSIFFTLFFVDLPTYLEKGLHISLTHSALISALPYIGMWVGSLSSSSVCDKLVNDGYLALGTARKLFNSISFFGIAIALIAMSLIGAENKALIIGTLIAGFVISGFYSAGYLVNHLDLSPHYAGVLLSFTNTAATLGSIATPLVTSLILHNDPTDISRWRTVFLVTASTTILSNVGYLAFSSAERQVWDKPGYMNKSDSDAEEMQPALQRRRTSIPPAQ